jgi:hypothetical protein
MWRAVAALALGASAASGAVSSPTDVAFVHDPAAATPVIQSGRILVTWTAAAGSVDHYDVRVAPLDYADSLRDPLRSGFVLVSLLRAADVFCVEVDLENAVAVHSAPGIPT